MARFAHRCLDRALGLGVAFAAPKDCWMQLRRRELFQRIAHTSLLLRIARDGGTLVIQQVVQPQMRVVEAVRIVALHVAHEGVQCHECFRPRDANRV